MEASVSTLSTTEKLFGTTALDSRRAEMVRRTYMLLSISVVAAMAGGWIGSRSEPVITFFLQPWGWLVAMLLLNGIPWLALAAARSNPVVAIGVLALDDFISGMVLSPLLFVAAYFSRAGGLGLVEQALMITAAVFAAITMYIMVSGRQFSAPRGLLFGAFVALTVGIGLNLFMQSSLLGTILVIGVGLFGVVTLVYATSDVLNNPEYQDPIVGALMLFAALFNIFQAVLNILLRIAAGSRD